MALVEQRITEPLNVQEMADEAGYSLFHFCRQFNRYVHHSPYDYLIRRRLSQAAGILKQGRKSITEIALDFCFSTPEGFSRAFRRMFGLLPSRALRKGGIDIRLCLPPLDGTYLADLLESDGFSPRHEALGPSRFQGIAERVKDPLPAIKRHLFDNDRSGSVILHYTPDWMQEGILLFSGNDSSGEKDPHMPLTCERLPGRYAVFSIPSVRKIRSFLVYLFSTLIANQPACILPERLEIRKSEEETLSACFEWE
jgi:AraC-like DNA-binding protein